MFVVHPGSILRDELESRAISHLAFALDIHADPACISRLLNEEIALSAELALAIGRYFENDPHFWLSLQSGFETAAGAFQEKN